MVEAVYWEHFIREFLRWRQVDSIAAITQQCDWCLLYVVASVRWPRVVAQALPVLQGAEPRDMTAEDWHAYIVRQS